MKLLEASHPYIPKTYVCLQEGYSFSHFLDDLKAGITVGLIALPLAMAFAIGSGVSPEKGIFTAIIAGFLISLLGGSRVQIGGPTGAYVVLVFATVQKHGLEGLALATLLAGGLLILFGLLGLGKLIRHIPQSVITGFTAGIAATIFVSQIKDFCGLQLDSPQVSVLGRFSQYFAHIDTINPFCIALSLLSVAAIVWMRSMSKKIPAFVVVMCAATLLCSYFDLPVATIESSFGQIVQSLPDATLPDFSLSAVEAVFFDALAIALLGGIESLLSAVVADKMTGYTHKPNCELVGQGLANIGSSIFGGIPATGAIARTSTSVQLGARTPIAGMIHAITLFLLMIFLARLPQKCLLGR